MKKKERKKKRKKGNLSHSTLLYYHHQHKHKHSMSFLAASTSTTPRTLLARHACPTLTAACMSTSTSVRVPQPQAQNKNQATFQLGNRLVQDFAAQLASNPNPNSNPSSASSTATSAATATATAAATAPATPTPAAPAALPTSSFAYAPNALPPRSDALLSFLVNLLMKDGKKAQAERFVTRMLAHIATLTNADPLPLVYAAVQSVRPLVKMQSRKQGGKNIQVPTPLNERQSTRKALVWIIDASKKRADREIHKRLATEFIAVVEATSNALTKKEDVHKIATANRANTSVRI